MILAPIVRNRKGSHLKLLQELSHEGFLRARIDGEVEFLEEASELDGNKNHTIEIVVDRLKVRQDISSRFSVHTFFHDLNGATCPNLLAPSC